MKSISLFLLCLIASQTQSAMCPDPVTSSLKYGKIPAPWVISPFSEHDPQGDKNTRFVRANILVVGIGRGVVCHYQNSIGSYSIWWQVSVKIPARIDYNWIESGNGYVCTLSPESCIFHTINGSQMMR